MPDLAFPPVGRLGFDGLPSILPHLLGHLIDTRYYARLRLPFVLLNALCSRSVIDTLLVPLVRVLSQSSLTLRNSCVNARPAWSPGTPFPACSQGNKWLSQVSRLPLWIYALLSDPGGVLNTCLCVFRTAAFRLNDGVGFPINNTDGYPLHNFVLLVHNIADFGAPLHGLHSCSPWLRTPVTGLTRKVRYCPVG